jgi:hypothetical protein
VEKRNEGHNIVRNMRSFGDTRKKDKCTEVDVREILMRILRCSNPKGSIIIKRMLNKYGLECELG